MQHLPLWTDKDAARERYNVYGVKSDIWQLGILVYEMMFRCLPFGVDRLTDPALVSDKVLLSEVDFPPEADSGCRHFIRMCLQKDPRDRLTAAELLRHPWIVSMGGACNLIEITTVKPSGPIDYRHLAAANDKKISWRAAVAMIRMLGSGFVKSEPPRTRTADRLDASVASEVSPSLRQSSSRVMQLPSGGSPPPRRSRWTRTHQGRPRRRSPTSGLSPIRATWPVTTRSGAAPAP